MQIDVFLQKPLDFMKKSVEINFFETKGGVEMLFIRSFLPEVADYCTKRIEKYGAPYFVFSVFGIINYPLACMVLIGLMVIVVLI